MSAIILIHQNVYYTLEKNQIKTGVWGKNAPLPFNAKTWKHKTKRGGRGAKFREGHNCQNILVQAQDLKKSHPMQALLPLQTAPSPPCSPLLTSQSILELQSFSSSLLLKPQSQEPGAKKCFLHYLIISPSPSWPKSPWSLGHLSNPPSIPPTISEKS